MTDAPRSDPSLLWFPVARIDDMVARHVFHGQLLGRELALWRADDGFVNVWENRCLHRGVRLTLGCNEGQELSCRYHGWRYANRTAGCTYIPAHPADSPARTVCNVTFPARERFGLVWSGEAPGGEPGAPTGLVDGASFGLRNLPVNAEPAVVLGELAEYRFEPSGASGSTTVEVTGRGEMWIELTSHCGDARSTVVFFVQPVDASRAVVRGVLAEVPAVGDRLDVLRHHHGALSRWRDSVERRATKRPRAATAVPHLQRPGLAGSESVEVAPPATRAALRVVVSSKSMVADGICAFELRAIDGQMPTFRPGAHIDVQLPNGATRQYSLVNGPGELDRYVIGVKREPDSRGGSVFLHDSVREGDVMVISAPHHNFVLRRDSRRTLLIAGGIGITPLLAMAQSLRANGLDFDLHYFAQSAAHLAFPDRIAALGGAVVTHLGLSPAETATAVAGLLAYPADGEHVYACGPGPMLDTVRATAAARGWPDHAVHFEYFANATDIDTSSAFDVQLARSARTVHVAAGTSVLEAVRACGIAVPSSCEQGACGTCMVTVLSGTPEHQDVYLSASERAANDRMLVCVSRSLGSHLVLDL